jgi:polar amino acid transport system substrate-binding protein
VKLYEKWYGSKVDPGSSISTIFPGYGPPGFKGYDEKPHELACN